MTGVRMFGMPEDRAESHRRALGYLRKELESYDLRCRPVERLHLPMRGWYYEPILLPPEMDVYGGGRLIATVTVVDVPGGGGAWFLVKEPGGLPVEAHSVDDFDSAARDIAARRERTELEHADHPLPSEPGFVRLEDADSNRPAPERREHASSDDPGQ
ncbi:hypothetical protein GCM10022226_37680 [Sphaerisporangium flaviroseum]|uniref:Uncharacterized protein n=1 Tax=Sphaerisporangium flaviroseum TaxID=509199 RepID=A0ABP7IA97_9ACTN